VQAASESAFYYYDEVGNRDYMELELDGSAGYEIKTGYTYDNMNRLTDLLQQKTGAVSLATYNYTLKADGMRHSLDENFPANEDRRIVYTYDNLNRLTQEIADSDGDGYDSHYTYDLAGNRTQRVVNVNGQPLTTDYTYDPNTDRLIKETHSGPVYGFGAGNEQYYAYAAGGGYFYRDSQGHKIGSVRAFFMGLPSLWSRYLFVLLMVLLPVMLFVPGVVGVIRRLVLCYGRPTRLRLGVPRKGICLLVAFVMLFGPEEFHSIAQADVQYADLSTATWANGDTTIEYTYDANGSVETKTTKVTSTQAVKETVIYNYNLQNRLAKVTTEDENGDKRIVEYTYNDEGIRVKAYSYDIPYGQSIQNEKTVVYLVDSFNHTGYTQTLEEKTYNGTDTSGMPDSLRTYLIGDDIIAQSTDGNTQYLLYDGHGSTRQLAEYDGSVTIADSYSYDGYGVLLQDDAVAQNNPGKASQQATNLLYAGEHFDTDAQQYYLRARYYNPLNGRFNRIDPFGGNYSDPQSLHKYLYCHANPINNVDPSGDMILFGYNITGVMMGIAITAMAIITTTTIYNGVRHGLEPLSIAWQVIQNLAVFGLIIGVTLLTGPLALAASITLLAAFVAGIIGIVKNWPNMDTTDKVILAVNFICFLAFAGAVRTATMPKPPPASSFQPGACSKLPESYYSKPIVDMRGAPAKSPTNAAGYARNASYFWKQIKNSNPEYFSAENLARIQASKPISPKVDATWIKYHPQHQSYMGKTLVHHHIGQGPYATPLPQTVHYSWTRFFHTNQGKQ